MCFNVIRGIKLRKTCLVWRVWEMDEKGYGEGE
jgi:hypothetical protein